MRATLLVVFLTCGTLVAAPVNAQAPKKARAGAAAEADDAARFEGRVVQLRGKALPGMGEALTAFYARGAGEELKRFVVSFREAPQLPKTRVTRGGRELAPDAAAEALAIDGLRVDVRYRPDPIADWEAYAAIEVAVEGFDVPTDATGAVPDLVVVDVAEGNGREARPGDRVTVHYTGWLLDGTKFDSSRDSGQPFTFRLGNREVIRGWDLGVTGMRVGGTRRLTIPPHLGYGRKGAGDGQIPGNATLVFDVELLKVQ